MNKKILDLAIPNISSNPEVIANARPYFFWVVMVPVASFTAFLWDGIFILFRLPVGSPCS